MKFLRTFLLSLSIVVQCFAADGWRVFSTPFPIYSAAKYGNGVVYATGGGVRIKTPTFDRVYTANNGLETASFCRRTSIVKYTEAALRREAEIIARFGAMEMLDAHGRAGIIRFDKP